MRTLLVTIASLTVAASASPAVAQTTDSDDAPPRAEKPRHTKVDPRFRAIEQILTHHGPSSPYFGPDGLGDVRTDGVAAYLRFARPLSRFELAALQKTGVELLRRDGEPIAVGTVYGAFVPFSVVDTLTEHGLLRSAEVAWHPRIETPLEVTGGDIGATGSIAMPIPGADGTGSVIGDIDSGIDVLHPHFFFADGGAFPWIDTNDNQSFDPGIDAVDYDRDGEAGGNETGRVLDGAWLNDRGRAENADGALQVHLDWVYADSNRDAERNVGADAGFTELDPGYGEPLFVVDDVNRNGSLDVDERLYLLATSKVRRFVTTERTWIRGEDLIRSVESPVLEQSFHGTGVASILVGGQPIGHQRVGIAPGAEVVMYSSHIDAARNSFEDVEQLESLDDAVENEIDAVVHEWTNPYTAPLDGSGNFEAAMGAASDAGVVQVNPLGNLNLAQKHAELDVPAGGSGELTFVVDSGFQWGNQTLPYASIYGSVHWRGDQMPTLTLVSPAGPELELPLDGSYQTIGDNYAQATHSLSERGTNRVVLFVWNENQNVSVAQGDWSIRISDTTVDDRFVGRIADYYSSWNVGVRWRNPTQDAGTVVYPATADAAIGVAAYAGRHDQPWENSSVGELRNFSGRGPRIDGAAIVDLAAPDDPYAAMSSTLEWREAGYGRSWFRTFGGTSGAGPHVAGTVALLRSLEPDISSAEVKTRIVASARTDSFTPDPSVLPDAAWGAGKLDVFAAVHGVPAPEENAQPIGRVDVEFMPGGAVTLSGGSSSDADGDELSYRWDFEYDGVWDTAWSTSPTVEASYEVGAEVLVRLDVRDGRGGKGGAVHRFTVVDGSEMMSADAGGGEQPDVDVVRVVDEDDDEKVELIDATEKSCGGCSAAPTADPWLLVLLAAFGIRRRRLDALRNIVLRRVQA